MIEKWPVVYFCVVGCFLYKVDAKFCERTEAVTSMVEVTFSTAYIETYHGQCYYGCIKTQWATSVGRRYVPKREWKTVKYCCKGYIRTDDSSNDSDIACEPICMPACKNGHCSAPGECTCDTGYILDPKDTHNCLPSCDPVCEHGACVAPNKCQCDFGYTPRNINCQPVCTEPCHNGTCVAPETCECLPGYRKSEKNLCEPYCSKGCDNGFCTAPETCRCNPGWYIKEDKDVLNKQCEPICSEPCGNGSCVAPGTCVCKTSYRKSKSGNCEPECTPPCGNGTCVAPNKCSCFPGYHIDTAVCKPTCFLCKDAHCIAPNKCLPIETHRTTQEIPNLDAYDDDINIFDDYYPDLFRNLDYEKDNYDISISNYSNDTKTKSIKNPFHNTRPDNKNTDKMEYSYGASTHSYETNTVTGSKQKSKNEGIHSDDTENTKAMRSVSWFQQHWVSIYVPILVVTAVAIMLLVWQRAPIIIFLKGRSYVVESDPVENNDSRPIEDIQISAINEKQKPAQK